MASFRIRIMHGGRRAILPGNCGPLKSAIEVHREKTSAFQTDTGQLRETQRLSAQAMT